MTSTVARIRPLVACLALLLAAAPVARGGAPSDRDVYSARLKARYRVVRLSQASVMVLVAVDADSPLRALPVDPSKFDIVLAMDGEELTSPADVERHYAATTVTLINTTTRQSVTYTVDLPPPAGGQAAASGRILGVYGDNCVLPIAGNGGPAGYRGLAITGVVPGSPAAQIGLAPGLMIGKFNDDRIIDMDSLRQAVAKSGPVASVVVYRADGAWRRVDVRLGD